MKRRFRSWLWGAWIVLFTFHFSLFTSCGGSHKMSPEELAHKLDSVKTIEIKEKLALQGINLDESDNPLKLFYDSLDIQSLPISYTEDYVNFLPGFKPVPQEIVSYLNFEGRSPKAITLTETIGARLLLLAADEQEHQYSLWLYSLDDEYIPVDKLCLYAIEDEDDIAIKPENYIQYFSITSDYEIHLLDYSGKTNKAQLEEVYTIDAARKFVLQRSQEFTSSDEVNPSAMY